MPEPVEGNEFSSDLVQRPQFGANRPSALGIGAASFASGTGTTFGSGDGNWGRDFLSEEKTKSEQRYSGKPDAKRNAQNKTPSHQGH